MEGFSKETAFRFEDTIGPVWERKSHYLLWSYMTTNGLGFHEYLQFCEDAGIDAMYVFNCGMTCQGRCPDYFDEKLTEEFYNDTVNAILYATAEENTYWGKRRAENGHPKPFTVLKYLEIGNENWGEEYNKRYKYFYERLKQQFPQFIYISTDHTERAGIPTEYVGEHFYSDPVFFASNHDMYDNISGEIKIYCGEYASTIGCKEGILYGALGEAAFLTGIERNQDKVPMTSYAPLLQNVAYKAWEPDMILFNNHESYCIPSYNMLSMFAGNRGDYVCSHDVITEYDIQKPTGCFKVTENIRDIILNGNSVTEIKGDNKNNGELSFTLNSDSLHLSFWDNYLPGEDQNHYDWIIENNTSKVIHYNGWSQEIISGKRNCDMTDTSRVYVRLINDSYELRINDKIIHKGNLKKIPHITAVCTVDKASNQLITKAVNISEREIPLKLDISGDISKKASVTVLTADSYSSGNSFKEKQAVIPVSQIVELSEDYTIS